MENFIFCAVLFSQSKIDNNRFCQCIPIFNYAVFQIFSQYGNSFATNSFLTVKIYSSIFFKFL